MTVFRVETYVVKPEKQEEHTTIMKKWVAYTKKNKENCKEMKSWKLLSQMIGSNVGGYIEISEFDSLAELEKFMSRVFHGHDEFIETIVSKFTACVVPGTYSIYIWNPVM